MRESLEKAIKKECQYQLKGYADRINKYINFLRTEEFIDQVIERINKKQLKK